jgi:hypothetical protein
MAWKVEGRYFENCPCDVPCPCTASLDFGADTERCTPILVFHVDSGEVEGVDVSGLTVVAVGDTPRVMTDGGWRLGMVIDANASDEQAEKLGAVFSGQLGGPMEGLAPLISEQLGVERAVIEFDSDGGSHAVKVGDDTEVAVQDVVPFGVETGEPVKLAGVFHPAGDTLTVSKATTSRIRLFGMDLSHEGKSGFSTRFSWSA